MLERLLVIAALVLTAPLARAEWDYRADLTLFGQHRELNQRFLSDFDGVSEGAFALGSDFSFTYEWFKIEARPEIRGLASPGVGALPTDPARTTIASPKRAMNIGAELSSDPKNGETYFNWEKLYFSIQTDYLEVAAGRRPLGLGVLKYLPVWNKFTVLLPSHSGPPFIYNPDNAIARFQYSFLSVSALAIEGEEVTDAVRLGQVNLFSEWVEVQTLFGQWWDHSVAGLALTSDIGGISLKAEGLWVGLEEDDVEKEFQGGYGIEYATSENVSLLLEGFFRQDGATNKEEYSPTAVSLFTPFRAQFYMLGFIDWRLSTDWKWTTGPFVNLVDGSFLYLNDLRWSINDETEMIFSSKTPIGSDRSELSAKTFIFADDSSVGFPYIFNVTLKTFF